MSGQQVVLAGLTRKGESRVHQHGSVWTIMADGKFRGTPALLLSAPDGDMRWVLKDGDADFEIKN